MKTQRKLKKILIPVRDERGIALILAILVVTLLLLLGGHFMTASLTENTIARNDVNAARAFHLAEAGTEHARKTLQALDLTQVLDGTTDVFAGGNTVSLAGGSYTVQVTNNIAANGFPRGTILADPSASATVDGDKIVVVTSTATFQNGLQIVETVLQSEGGPLPAIPAAVVQVSNGWNDMDVGGTVSGFDESTTCADQAGHFHRGGSVIIEGSTVSGDPASRNYDSATDDPMWDDPDQVVAMIEEWMNDPAAVTITSNTPPATMGTAANPQITVWDTTAGSSNSSASFTGYGILIIDVSTKKFKLKSSFEFHGLIVAYAVGNGGNNTLSIEGGNGQVLHGAILAANNESSPPGEATEVGVLNGAEVYYNCDDVAKYVKPVVGGGAMNMLSWRRP